MTHIRPLGRLFVCLSLISWGTLMAQGPPAASIPVAENANAAERVRAAATNLAATQEALTRRLGLLDVEFATLRKEIAAITPSGKPPDEPQKPKAPQQVRYRPPLERETKKDSIMVVCESGTLTLIDLPALTAHAKTIRDFREGQAISYPHSPFDFVVKFREQRLTLEVRRKAGAEGRGVTVATSDRERMRELLSKIPADSNYPDFMVYPDSYPLFRAAREVAWEMKLEFDWTPMSSGKPIVLGAGAGGGTTQ